MMDRALQERIIGAAVLVLVMVLVVPVFLDGPDEDGEILTERVPLPGQAEQENRTVVLDRDRTEPVPSNHTAPEPVPASQPEPSQSEPTSEPPEPDPAPAEDPPTKAESKTPEKVESQPAPEPSATGMWAVQLGSFGNQENAERLAAELRKAGHAAFLSQVSTSDGQRHRVRIGPQKDRDAANAVAAQLKSEGLDAKVLPHP
jgi:DedD protein